MDILPPPMGSDATPMHLDRKTLDLAVPSTACLCHQPSVDTQYSPTSLMTLLAA